MFISQGNQASFFSLTCRYFSEINFFEVRFSLRPGVYDKKPLGALARQKKLPKQGTVFLRNEREVVEKICMEILCKVQDNRVLKYVSCLNVHCLINGLYIT